MSEELCPIQTAKLEGEARTGKMKKGRKKGEYSEEDYDCTGCFALLCWEDVLDNESIKDEDNLMHFIDKVTEQKDDISNFLAWFAHEYKGEK